MLISHTHVHQITSLIELELILLLKLRQSLKMVHMMVKKLIFSTWDMFSLLWYLRDSHLEKHSTLMISISTSSITIQNNSGICTETQEFWSMKLLMPAKISYFPYFKSTQLIDLQLSRFSSLNGLHKLFHSQKKMQWQSSKTERTSSVTE